MLRQVLNLAERKRFRGRKNIGSIFANSLAEEFGGVLIPHFWRKFRANERMIAGFHAQREQPKFDVIKDASEPQVDATVNGSFR